MKLLTLELQKGGTNKYEATDLFRQRSDDQTRPEVVEAMLPYFTEYYGNPSSVYEFSGISKKAVQDSREIIAGSLGAKTNEIYFTAGGSESDNWALIATAEAYADKGKTHHYQ